MEEVNEQVVGAGKHRLMICFKGIGPLNAYVVAPEEEERFLNSFCQYLEERNRATFPAGGTYLFANHLTLKLRKMYIAFDSIAYAYSEGV